VPEEAEFRADVADGSSNSSNSFNSCTPELLNSGTPLELLELLHHHSYFSACTTETGRLTMATAGVIAGIMILSKVDWTQVRIGRAELETLISTFFFTGQILVLDARRFFRNRTKMVSSVMFLLTGLVFAMVAILANHSFSSYKLAAGVGGQFYLIGILVIFCTLGSFNLMNRCQKYIPSSEAALIYTLEPVSTSLFATFLPALLGRLVGVAYENEPVTFTLLFGGGLILSANLLMQVWGHTPVAHAGETAGIDGRLKAFSRATHQWKLRHRLAPSAGRFASLSGAEGPEPPGHYTIGLRGCRKPTGHRR
jgi:hypothetical protein